jgi:hypothetical protein
MAKAEARSRSVWALARTDFGGQGPAVQHLGGGPEADPGPDVLHASAPSPLLFPAEQQRWHPQTPSHQQRPRSLRAAQFVGRHREQIGSEFVEVDRHVSGGGGGVDMQDEAPLPACLGHGGDRLGRAHLMVTPLAMHEGGIGTDGGQQFGRVDAAPSVHAHGGDGRGPG